MFSYTDDAIVTSSPTGRHLSTVIRHPAGMPDDQWRKHADQVCQLLNELDSKAKANSLSLHLQTVGRVERIDTLREQYAETIKRGFAQTAEGPSLAELIDSGYLAALERPFGPTWPFEDQMPLATEATFASARIAELEKQLDEAKARLECDHLVELSDLQLRQVYSMPPGSTMPIESQRVIIKRVE